MSLGRTKTVVRSWSYDHFVKPFRAVRPVNEAQPLA